MAASIFIPFIWVASGVSLFAGLHFFITGLLRRQERVFLAFGCVCLLIGTYMLFSAQWYRAPSVEAVMPVVRWEMALACLMYPAFAWFFALYSGQRLSWPFWLLLAGYGALQLINLMSPYSFMYTHMILAEPIVLPWGETVSNFNMTVAPAAFFYYALNYSIFIWAFWRCYVMWRAGRLYRAVPVFVFLLLELAAVIHTGLIDNQDLPSIYYGEFPPLVLVVLMSVWLGLELDRRTVALASSLVALNEETAKRRAYEERLHHMAYHDHLTELPNRRRLPEEFTKAQRQQTDARMYGAMLFLDLDHFKTINDSLGHDFGDRLLQEIAQRLRGALPPEVTPIRLGGDEFAVILPCLSETRGAAEASAVQVAQAINGCLTRSFTIDNHKLAVGVSIGVAAFPGFVHNESRVMRQADAALYQAKKSGRNLIQVFTSDLQHAADERLVLEKGLRLALEKGELDMYFQPQVHARGGMLGAEALMRWRHPQLGYIAPSRFIPIAEETGLIHALGDFALRRACECLVDWENRGLPFRGQVSVNVSPWQLCRADFPEVVARATEQCGVNRSRLTLEITEGVLLQDPAAAAAAIQRLSETGIRFSIDDFGTGYSALEWIKKIAFHELKIDRSFVHDMGPGPRDSFIETIISIASRLNMRVVAEGVETEAQRSALIEMGCDALQGFLICPPVDRREFEEWAVAYRV